MYISKLSIYGFKSFVKRAEIEFGQGITSIVGPNGCGKTNIVDAIRWVIGEQKSSILRADRITDVIFNGTATRRPLNLAEVSLTIHNVSGRVPIAYVDIEITRRLYRNGESEYFINKNLCRLKDITDLFIDTGMGANAYSIIELKMIEDILSENPEERKRLFEEAAGVNKYRVQRKAALRKLDATRDDLLRLNDIISEVDAKVKNLKRQFQRYEKYQDTTQKLIEAEVLLATCRVADLRHRQSPLIENLNQRQAELTTISQELTAREADWQSQQTALNAKEADLQNQRGVLENLHAARAQLETDARVFQEQTRNLTQTINRLTEEQNQLEKNNTVYRERSAKLGREETDLQQVLIDRREQFRQISEAQLAVEQRYKALESALQALQDERFRYLREQAEFSARYNSLQENIQQREKELSAITYQIEEQQSNLQALQEAQVALQDENDRYAKQRSELQRKIAQVLEQRRQLGEQKQTTQDQLRGLTAEMDRVQTQIQFYSGIIQSREGFSPGLQYVLDHLSDFPGVRGALSDLLAVDASWYLAVEAILKDISRLLVADSRPAALAALATLARSGRGRVAIIPLDGQFDETAVKVNRPELQPLLRYVKSDKRLEPLKIFLFRNVYCCPDDKLDELIGDHRLDQLTLVTERGRYRDAQGFLGGGAETADSNILVGRAERLANLQRQYEKVSKQHAQLTTRLKELTATDERHRQQGDELQKQAEQLAAAHHQLEEKQHGVEGQILQTNSVLQTLRDNQITLNTALVNFRERLTKENPAQVNLTAQVEQLDQQIAQKKSELENLKSAVDETAQRLQNERVELINLENQFRNLSDSRRLTERDLQTTADRQTAAQAELQSTRTILAELNIQIQCNEADLQNAVQVLQAATQRYQQTEAEYQVQRTSLEKLNQVLYDLRHRRERLSDELKNLELENSQFAAREKEIITVLNEKYNRTIPDVIPTELPSLAETQQAVERHRRNLELIGMVNMAVKEEYNQEDTRLRFLTEQRDDLEASEKGLKEVITQIDNIARQQFLEIFEKIRGNFKTTFSIFFGGGESDLRLIGETDPLEAEIDIWACPDGKKMRSLKMLSAGEKALTAIALLFAIYQVKPSPFCILDEVDAPLDDENTRRFTNVIRTFAEKTQFIVVTHNKSTMAIANALYGVTMAEKGISQIVSVKLE